MISVIIPMYNSEKYISECLESIFNQTYKNYEIIIVNDGSTDRSLEVVKKYRNEKIKVYTQENKGVSFARNKGIELAKGDYIYFMDSDDIIQSNLFENAIKQLKNVGIFSFGYEVIDKNIKYYSNKDKNGNIFSSEEFLKELFDKNIYQSICSVIYKKSVLADKKFKVELGYGEDLDFQFTILSECEDKVYYDANCYFKYIKRENSITKSPLNISKVKILETYERRFKEFVEDKKIINFYNYYTCSYFYLIKEMLKMGIKKDEYLLIKKLMKEQERNLIFSDNCNLYKKIYRNRLLNKIIWNIIKCR